MLRASGCCSGSQGHFPTQDTVCGSDHLSIGSKERIYLGCVVRVVRAGRDRVSWEREEIVVSLGLEKAKAFIL